MPVSFPTTRAFLCTASALFLLTACQGVKESGGMSEAEKALLTKGDVAQALGRQEEALGHYREAAAASHGATRAHLELADIYASRNNTQAALEIMESAYALNSTNGEVLKSYAQQLLLASENKKALKIALEGLAQNPHDIRLLNIAGVAYDRSGQHDKAQMHYHTAMSLAKAMVDREYTANNLALSYVATRDYDRAIALLLAQMPAAQNKPVLRQLLALAYGAKGDTDKAYELGLMDLNVDEIAENLRFYEQLRNGTVDASVLFAPAN